MTIQVEALKAVGCTTIRAEKVSGTSTTGRAELATLLDFLRAGDTVVVIRIDRLSRFIADLQDAVRTLKAKGVFLRAIEHPVDTGTEAGKASLDMLGEFAELETHLRKERQLQGVSQAKAAGVYKGRQATSDVAAVRKLQSEGVGDTEIAECLGINRASVYCVLKG